MMDEDDDGEEETQTVSFEVAQEHIETLQRKLVFFFFFVVKLSWAKVKFWRRILVRMSR